jgi:hypothetical protein
MIKKVIAIATIALFSIFSALELLSMDFRRIFWDFRYGIESAGMEGMTLKHSFE